MMENFGRLRAEERTDVGHRDSKNVSFSHLSVCPRDAIDDICRCVSGVFSIAF